MWPLGAASVWRNRENILHMVLFNSLNSKIREIPKKYDLNSCLIIKAEGVQIASRRR